MKKSLACLITPCCIPLTYLRFCSNNKKNRSLLLLHLYISLLLFLYLVATSLLPRFCFPSTSLVDGSSAH